MDGVKNKSIHVQAKFGEWWFGRENIFEAINGGMW